MLPHMLCQQVGMDNDSVFSARFEQAAQRIAARVGQVLRPQQGIAERQAGGDTVVPQQGKRVARVAVAAADASAAPEAALRRAVDRTDAAPVIKILPVLKKQRQKQAVERIKFKQARQMILRSELIHRSLHSMVFLFYCTTRVNAGMRRAANYAL